MAANHDALSSAASSGYWPTAVPTVSRLATAAYCLANREGKIIAADQVVQDWVTQNGESFDGHWNSIEDLIAAPRLSEHFQHALASESPAQFAARFASGASHSKGCSVLLTVLRGGVEPFVLVRIELSNATEASTTLDPLTQLPDRRAINAAVAAWRFNLDSAAPVFAVLFLDLDNFKAVNDRYGHAVGDAVLRTLAARWPSCVRDGDLVARYGGDEFVLLIRDAASSDEIEPVIRRLREATALPIAVGDLTLSIHATVGWSTPTGADWSLDQLIAAADRDMYARKGRVLR